MFVILHYLVIIKKSYCELFLLHIKNKYKVDNLRIGGFIGFLFEDRKKKKTYIAENYNDNSKKYTEQKIKLFFINK